MLGSFGTVRHQQTLVHNVPILFCPVCNRIDVHPAIEGEFEILVEYAQGDQAREVDFSDFVSVDNLPDLFENCTMTDDGNYADVLRQQIDIALDLLSVAKALADHEWHAALKMRLQHLSQRLQNHNSRKEMSRYSA